MKKSRYLIVGVLLFSFQHSYGSLPDEWRGPKETVLFSNWSVNLNVGLTSYFGDLSRYDLELTNKISHESKVAYGFKLTKQIRSLKLSGQVIYGGFKSSYRPEHTFETRMLEYSFQAGLDVFNLVWPRYPKKYGLEIYVGAGQFMFSTAVDTYFDGILSQGVAYTGVPEFVYFFGSELYCKINDRFRFTANLSIRQVQNDNIDKYIRNGDFDYYSLFNVGITYSLGKIQTPIRDKAQQKVNSGSPVWRNYR